MLTVPIDQLEGISGADIPEQAVKKIRVGCTVLSLPSPRAFFAFLFTERLFTTILQPGTGYLKSCACVVFYFFPGNSKKTTKTQLLINI